MGTASPLLGESGSLTLLYPGPPGKPKPQMFPMAPSKITNACYLLGSHWPVPLFLVSHTTPVLCCNCEAPPPPKIPVQMGKPSLIPLSPPLCVLLYFFFLVHLCGGGLECFLGCWGGGRNKPSARVPRQTLSCLTSKRMVSESLASEANKAMSMFPIHPGGLAAHSRANV